MTNRVEQMREKLVQAKILPLKAQGELWNEILSDKLVTVLPEAMEQAGIDMWLVINRENCEDPAFKTLVAWDMPSARRTTILAFYYDKKANTVEKMILGGPSPEMMKIYSNVLHKDEEIWTCLNRIINERAPKKIAVNKSENYGFCDGLTSTLEEELYKNIPAKLKDSIVSGEDICIRWLEQVTKKELEVMQVLADVTQDIIKASFSREFIKVGTTTTTDMEWFMRDCISSLGFDFWFGPDVDLQRKNKTSSRMFNTVIEQGDLVHCDIGVVCRFIPLHTDIQWLCYILKDGENQAPTGIIKLLKEGNRFQDIVASNFKVGRQGNEVFVKSIDEAKAEGIRPMLYTHPLGTFGHGAGPTIGIYGNQNPSVGRGERNCWHDTCFALELNIHGNVLEWDNEEIYIYLEEDIYFDGKSVHYINGRETALIEV